MCSLEEKHKVLKPLEIDQEWCKKAAEVDHEYMPLFIEDGDEDKEGAGKIVEIDFDKINSIDDITIDLEDVEVEKFDFEKGEMLVWLPLKKLKEKERLNIYYGADK